MSSDQPREVAGAQTLVRGLRVLEAVAAGHAGIRAIVAVTGYPRSTVHRLAQALQRQGYLRTVGDGELGLGPRLIELGFEALDANPLTSVAARYLDALSAQVRDTVHLAVEEQESVLYLAKIPGTRGAEMRSRVGLRMPMTRTGVGKALLLDSPDRWERLYLAEVPRDSAAVGGAPVGEAADFVEQMGAWKRRGHVYDLEENEPGVRCVAAPIRGADGAIRAAVSVAATRPYMSAARMRELAPVVRHTADAISAELGWRGPR